MLPYASARSRRDRKYEKNGYAPIDEALHGPVEETAHGGVVASHRLFHAAYCAYHVALVYHLAAADADE